jgi:CRISPR/Cas system CMR subunit Cmr4 (Cas7 group RAMP superfamily)
VASLLAAHREDKTWKKEAEDSIHVVQTAGNQLEEKVRLMSEAAIHVRLDQEDKIKQMSAWIKERDADITQLQKDILDQDSYNKEQ